MTEQTPQQSQEKQKPLASHRAGTTEIAVWKRKNEHGTFYDVTHSRSYKDQNGDWQKSKSIPEQDLLKTAQLFEKAHNTILEDREQARTQYIAQQQQAANAAPSQAQEPDREH